MKKIIFAVVILSLLIPVPAFAEEMKKEKMPTQNPVAPGEGFGGMMDRPSVMAVFSAMIVLAGNKLLKYDADLNLVKEVEIPMPGSGKQNPSMGKMPEKMIEEISTPAAAESQDATISESNREP